MSKKEKPPVRMTSEEKGALRQIAKYDRRIVDENTVVRLDKTTRNADGSVVRNYLVADGDKVKYKAKTVEKRGKQKLTTMATVKVVEKLPKANKKPGKVARRRRLNIPGAGLLPNFSRRTLKIRRKPQK